MDTATMAKAAESNMTSGAGGSSTLQATILNAASLQSWRGTGIAVLALTLLALWLREMAQRPKFPPSAPALFKAHDWPIFGSWRFFRERNDFYKDAVAASKTGNFSFYVGKMKMIGVSGEDTRKLFFETKGMDMTAGISVFVQSTPTIEAVDGSTHINEDLDFAESFNRTLAHILRGQNFGRNLQALTGAAQDGLEAAARAGGGQGSMNPFDDIYRIVYKMTMLTFGATEVAEDPKLLRKSLELFEITESSSSPSRLVFPWLPTPNHLRRLWAGTRSYFIFSKIVDARKKTNTRVDDSLQYLIDKGDSKTDILKFTLASLFAGQVNTGINAAWVLVYLATTPDWYRRVQREVDEAVAKHRTSSSQAPVDVLRSLKVEHWENEFPSIQLCLRETIRLVVVGSAFRRNISGRDLHIGTSGEIVPNGAFVIWSVDDMHMNPQYYPEPHMWNPGRFEDSKNVPFVGWGMGRHPCSGMRFAKLEVGIITAMFMAMFEFEFLDAAGRKTTTIPKMDRNRYSSSKPTESVLLGFKAREL